MITYETDKSYPSVNALVGAHAASRLQVKDHTLYSFSANAQEYAKNYTGWADLASNPPCPIQDIKDFAQEVRGSGIDTVILIGQGGSIQAPMTITQYNNDDFSGINLRTLDSVSPVCIRTLLADIDPKTTLVIQSSKSGGTIEPELLTGAVRDWFAQYLGEDELDQHFAAITDPGSVLERKAQKQGWLKVFHGEPTVGGRYSALSVFGLVPAALAGLDLERFVESAREAEEACSQDSVDNPAIVLASFMYDNYLDGRDKFSFLSPQRGRVLGLWIEQLVAESVGKQGKGVLPNIERDTLHLVDDPGDRSAIVYDTKIDLWDEQVNFGSSLDFVNDAIPRLTFHVEDVYDLAAHFVMWEYATAMLGFLMQVCPFDQPDVQSAKNEVLNILAGDERKPLFTNQRIANVTVGTVEVNVSSTLLPMMRRRTLDEALGALARSVRPGDFFTLNAFLPFDGEGRTEALDEIRHCMADAYGVAASLEMGPRYLHSTGQLQKDGPNTGVFLVISADEERDIPVDDPRANSLAQLEKAQALGDFTILNERGRRCLHVHLPNNAAITLRSLAKALRNAVDKA